jgi:hypothetical protein
LSLHQFWSNIRSKILRLSQNFAFDFQSQYSEFLAVYYSQLNVNMITYILDSLVPSFNYILQTKHCLHFVPLVRYIPLLTYLLTYLLTELSPSWEAANCAATQELPSILWNLKVHHRVHKSPPLVPILSQIDPVHTTPSYLRSILILSTYLRLGLPSGLFPSGFPTNILHAFLLSPFVLYALPMIYNLPILSTVLNVFLFIC